MSQYKPGDQVTVSRDGKVFLTQYTNVSGFATMTRTLGDNPTADLEEMHALVDVAFHDSVRRNLELVNDCYEAASDPGGDIDPSALLDYLHARSEIAEVVPAKVVVEPKGIKRKLVSKPKG